MTEKKKADAGDLLQLTLQLTQTHLDALTKKLASGDVLSPHEGISLCSYMKALSGLKKLDNEEKRMESKELSKMSDEELQLEIKKYADLMKPKKAKSDDEDETEDYF
jgi:hypothetical protein